jgi:hypothetical protein
MSTLRDGLFFCWHDIRWSGVFFIGGVGRGHCTHDNEFGGWVGEYIVVKNTLSLY